MIPYFETKLGTLYHGDCVEIMPKLIDKLGSNLFDMVLTDPPYDIDTSGGGIYNQSDKQYVQDLSDIKDGFSIKILGLVNQLLKKTNIYLFCSQKQIISLLDFFVVGKKCNYNILTWHKQNPVPACGNKYLTDTEFLLFFREKGVRVFGSAKTKSTYFVTPLNQKEKQRWGHPTIKPTHILKHLIINSSKENETVFDPFGGSGSTAVAAEYLGRKWVLIEKEKAYCEIIKKRMEKEFEQREFFPCFGMV